MAYTKLYMLKSYDYMLDQREDELFWEFKEVSITITTNTGQAEVPTSLGEVVGLVPLEFLDTTIAASTDRVQLSTDGVITSGAITVNANTNGLANGAHTFRFFIVGKMKRVDLT